MIQRPGQLTKNVMHIKRYSASYVIRKLKFKMTISYHYFILSGIPQIPKTLTPNTSEEVEWQEYSYIWQECKITQPLWKAFRCLVHYEICCHIMHQITHFGILPNELKTPVHTKPACKCIIAVLFVTAKT